MSEPTTSGHRVTERDLAAHDGLVHWVVRRQRLGSLAFVDALHEGRIGLWKALQSYDPTRGTRFSTYAVPAIAHAVWNAVAAASPEPIPLVLPLADWVDETDPSEPLHHTQVCEALHALVATLPARLRDVVIAHYGLDGALPQTFAQMGQRWAISRQRVHQLHRQALLVLSHPAPSHALRFLVDRQQRVAYQQTLARQRSLARARRRRTPRMPR